MIEYLLAFVERIKVIDCLKVGMTNKKVLGFNLMEGDTLSSTCLAYGIPTPFIQCSLRNKADEVDNGAITKREQRNFTRSIGRSLQFLNVSRTVSKIKCVVDGGPPERTVTEIKNVHVDCKRLSFMLISVTVLHMARRRKAIFDVTNIFQNHSLFETLCCDLSRTLMILFYLQMTLMYL